MSEDKTDKIKQLYFGDFRSFVIAHIKRIEEEQIAAYSTKWFLLKYLRRIVKTSEDAANPGRVAGSLRALMRFYVDNIDEHSALGDQCLKIYNEYRKTIRENQGKSQAE